MDVQADSDPAPETLAQRLRDARALLMAAIAGLDEGALRARPIATEWTSAEVLAHLLWTERLFLERAAAALERDDYVVVPTSGEQQNEHKGMAQRMPVPQIVHGLLALRRDTLRLVESVDAGGLGRTFRHPVRGELRVRDMFEKIAAHEAEHAEQLQTMRALAAS